MGRSVAGEIAGTLGVGAAAAIAFLAVQSAVPWVGFQDDMQVQYIGALREVAGALSRHELPLLSLHSWNGGALAGEYQYGVFSVVLLAVDALAWHVSSSPHTVAALLIAAHVFVLAGGSFRLARALGFDAPLSAFVAFVATLNGWTLAWATSWFPALASFAWIPWVATALTGRGAPRVLGAAFFTYLVVAAGWPHSDVMLIVAAAWMLAREVGMVDRVVLRQRAWTGAAACALGVLLAAPSWLCLQEYATSTLRLHSGIERDWVAPISGLPGMVFPAFVDYWSTWNGFVRPRPALELSNGVVPVALVVAGWATGGRAYPRAASHALVVVAICVVLVICPSFAPLRFSFRWLPLLHLALAVAAARAAEQLLGAPAPAATLRRVARALRNPGLVGAALTALVALDSLRAGLPATVQTLHLAALSCGVLALLALAWARASRALASWVACAVVLQLQAAAFFIVDHRDVGTWNLDDATLDQGPFDPSRVYLGLQYEDDPAPPGGVGQRDATLRPCNVPMLAGLTFVNGYSPMQPRAIREILPFDVHGYLPPTSATSVVREAARPGSALDELGVDGLVVSRAITERAMELDTRALLAGGGWALEASLEAGDVYARAAPPHGDAWALARPGLAAPAIAIAGSGLSWIDLDVSNADPARSAVVVLKRAYYPGYEATWNGSPVAIEPLRGILVAVRVLPGASGRLRVAYRPRGVRLGFPIAVVGAFLALVLAWLARARAHSAGGAASLQQRKPVSVPL